MSVCPISNTFLKSDTPFWFAYISAPKYHIEKFLYSRQSYGSHLFDELCPSFLAYLLCQISDTGEFMRFFLNALYLPLATCYLLFAVYYLLLLTCSTCFLLIATSYLMLIIWYLIPGACYLILDTDNGEPHQIKTNQA